MKTGKFTLMTAILVMAAVTGAAGQPARGNSNGNHEKNNRKEITEQGRREMRGLNGVERDRSDRMEVTREMKVHKSARVQEVPKVKKPAAKHYAATKKSATYGKKAVVKKHHYPVPHEGRYNYSHYYRKHHMPALFHGYKYYSFHPKYGHVVKRFPVTPVRVWSGNHPYYYSDGFFYRFNKKVGYVWVEEPWDIWFTELPYDAVRVNIGGHLYYRLGNAFFTASPRGFRLAMLPDHYYAAPVIQITARF